MAITGKKMLVGCAIGCGSIILIVVLAIVGFTIWLNNEGELLEPQALLGSDTQGYAEWTLDLEDPGTRGFVEASLEALQSIPSNSGELPDWMKGWMQQRQEKQAREDIMKLFPSVVAWTATPGERPGEDLHLLTASVKPLGNRLVLGDWVMGWFAGRSDDVQVEEHGDERIYQFAMGGDRSMAMFIRGADLFFTSNMETARIAVDRLSLAARSETSSDLDTLFRETEGDGPLRAVISNRNGQLARLWKRFAPTTPPDSELELWDSLRSVALGGGLQADGSVAVNLQFQTPDAGWADTHGEELAGQLRRGLGGLKLPLEIEQRRLGDQLQLSLSMPDLVQAIRDGAARLQEGIEREDGSRVKVIF